MAKKIEPKRGGAATATKKEERQAPSTFSFGRDNYMFILAGIAVLVVGYLLMIGGGSDTPDKFNPAIFDAQRVTVAPLVLLAGFGVVLYGIMKKPKQAAQ